MYTFLVSKHRHTCNVYTFLVSKHRHTCNVYKFLVSKHRHTCNVYTFLVSKHRQVEPNYFSSALYPNSCQGRPSFEVPILHTIRHTHTHTQDGTPTERSVRRRGRHLHTNTRNQLPCPDRDSNPRFHLSNGCRGNALDDPATGFGLQLDCFC